MNKPAPPERSLLPYLFRPFESPLACYPPNAPVQRRGVPSVEPVVRPEFLYFPLFGVVGCPHRLLLRPGSGFLSVRNGHRYIQQSGEALITAVRPTDGGSISVLRTVLVILLMAAFSTGVLGAIDSFHVDA